MCGIAGIIRYGDEPIDADVLKLMLIGNQHRGLDATGIAIAQPDGAIEYMKSDDTAWQFVTKKGFLDFLEKHLRAESWAVILHTRAATQGTPRDNNNNHPLTQGLGTIIHNGMIHNDDQLFGQMRLDRRAATDSDIIRAIVDKNGLTPATLEELKKISGSAAGAALHPEYPRRMILFRSGSPMMLASNPNFLAFASEKNTLHRSLRPWVQRFGLTFQKMRPDFDFSPMADNTSMIIDHTGVIKHAEFKALSTKYVEPHRAVHAQYRDRQARWDREEPKKVVKLKNNTTGKSTINEGWCKKCQRTWEVPEGKQPENYFCASKHGGCGDRLVAKFTGRVN